MQTWCTTDHWNVSVWRNKPTNSGCLSAAIPKCLWPGFLSCVQCECCIIKVKEISGTTHEPDALTGDFWCRWEYWLMSASWHKVLEINGFRLGTIHRWRWQNPLNWFPIDGFSCEKEKNSKSILGTPLLLLSPWVNHTYITHFVV